MTRTPTATDRPEMADTEELQAALRSVLRQVQCLDTSSLDPALVFGLSGLTRACLNLQMHLDPQMSYDHPPTDLLDRTTFDRLLELAGPDTTADLLDRVVEDLQSVQQKMITAQKPPQWDVLRSQSHILIGLAGAVGAVGLQGLSQDLSNIANAQTSAGIDPVLSQLMPTLADLIGFMQAQRIATVAAQ